MKINFKKQKCIVLELWRQVVPLLVLLGARWMKKWQFLVLEIKKEESVDLLVPKFVVNWRLLFVPENVL
jgi:hypothetical protein